MAREQADIDNHHRKFSVSAIMYIFYIALTSPGIAAGTFGFPTSYSIFFALFQARAPVKSHFPICCPCMQANLIKL